MYVYRFYDISALVACWYPVFYKEDYLQIFEYASFWLHSSNS